MSQEMKRRDAMGIAFGACAAVGGVYALAGMKAAWDPLPSVKAAGSTVVDVSVMEEDKLYTDKWRGKPVFIIKKSAAMVAKESNNAKSRDVIIGDSRFLVCIGLCTHLGCIPAYKKAKNKFACACHGAEFDTSGINTRLPAPLPMLIPPFKVDGNSLILGEAGEAYNKMKESGLLGKVELDPKA
ncbi:MAG TPA: ubiquinol-cytochrome c reductase iron-sulfur subunit [Arcobacter sp.]|nr:ubiquinol-cytochrome c reductase iron-sulfur subunit [Arcobacter sp.]